MEIQLTPDQQAFIHRAVASGRYQNAEDALGDAMARWEEDERTRIELLAVFDEAEADLESGQYTDHSNETLSDLADALKREARAERNNQRLA
jgi:putative addiction module CopG family antidote